MRKILFASIMAAGFGILAAPASALPISGAVGQAASENNGVEQVYYYRRHYGYHHHCYKRCWWSYGHYHCRRYCS